MELSFLNFLLLNLIQSLQFHLHRYNKIYTISLQKKKNMAEMMLKWTLFSN